MPLLVPPSSGENFVDSGVIQFFGDLLLMSSGRSVSSFSALKIVACQTVAGLRTATIQDSLS